MDVSKDNQMLCIDAVKGIHGLDQNLKGVQHPEQTDNCNSKALGHNSVHSINRHTDSTFYSALWWENENTHRIAHQAPPGCNLRMWLGDRGRLYIQPHGHLLSASAFTQVQQTIFALFWERSSLMSEAHLLALEYNQGIRTHKSLSHKYYITCHKCASFVFFFPYNILIYFLLCFK